MGLIANYSYLSDENLKELKSLDSSEEDIIDIVTALDDFDIEQALEPFDMMACKKAKLYPNIWDYDDEKDEIIEEILDYFEHMKEFYKKVLESTGHVMVTIY